MSTGIAAIIGNPFLPRRFGATSERNAGGLISVNTTQVVVAVHSAQEM